MRWGWIDDGERGRGMEVKITMRVGSGLDRESGE